jgi:formate hydrogenlyase subunit 4
MSLLWVLLGLLSAPLLPGVVARVKAVFGGRRGPPLLQVYSDVIKCLRKSAVYSVTTTAVFRAGPVVSLASLLTALLVIPFAGQSAVLSFDGDLVLLSGLLALARFATIAAALDTGSAFEGMGASREAQWSVLTEPALLLALAALARLAGTTSVSGMVTTLSLATLSRGGFALLLATGALIVAYLAENARMPFDDPNTHLELTMIHEVMVLDHGGPDLGYILYGQAVKQWVLGALVVGMLAPRTGLPVADLAIWLGGMAVVAVGTGVVESVSTRVRLASVPQLLLAACLMGAVALILSVLEWSV